MRGSAKAGLVCALTGLVVGIGAPSANATVLHYDRLWAVGDYGTDTERVRVIFDTTANTINGDQTWFYAADGSTSSSNWAIDIYELRDGYEFSENSKLVTPSTPTWSILQPLGNVSGSQAYETDVDSVWEGLIRYSPTINV